MRSSGSRDTESAIMQVTTVAIAARSAPSSMGARAAEIADTGLVPQAQVDAISPKAPEAAPG